LSKLPQALALATFAGLCAGCGGEGREPLARDRPLLEESLETGVFVRELLLTGELQAVRSTEISAPQTSVMQMRIQFMAEEGELVKAGEPLLRFDDSGLASRLLDLEASILDADTRLVAQEAELESALRDLEIELAERRHAFRVAELDASVEAGILARKEHAERQLRLQKAREELEETLARIESTRSRGRADLDVLRIERGKLEKDLLSARRDVDQLAIEAPAEGLVVYAGRQRSTSKWQEGDSCWPGQTLMRLPDLSEMLVVFRVNEVDAPLLEVGQEVEMSLDSFPGRELTGRVTHVPSMAVKRSEDSRISVFEIACTLSETWVGEMKPGMSVQGRIVVERRERATLLDRAAVRHDGERYWVLTESDGRLREVEIEPLARNAGHYLIEESSVRALLAQLAAEAAT
jgi:multidrug efflux pump subunit AcrA (membrane-fusion protein)